MSISFNLQSLLLEVKPDGKVAENAAWGEHFGFLTQILRLQAGILDEALRLIRKSHAAVDHPALLGIVGQLPPGARRFWRTFVGHARGKKSSGSLGKALAMIRNNVSFHYEPAELGDAYRRRFSGRQRPPFVSRGRSLASTRFYFADAAVERYMFRDAPEEAGRILFDVDFLNSLHGALWGIIQRFLQRGRGCEAGGENPEAARVS